MKDSKEEEIEHTRALFIFSCRCTFEIYKEDPHRPRISKVQQRKMLHSWVSISA